MAASVYSQLPTKFDFKSYYESQAGGGPSFPIFRARQRGGFLAPLLKRHGIPFLKWIGRQAASLASDVGNSYLDKGSLDKEDMKTILKTQGRKTAKSAIDSIRQQIGGGAMTYRRDARLAALVPNVTQKKEGLLQPIRGIRAPLNSEILSLDSHPAQSASRSKSTKKRASKIKKSGVKTGRAKKKKLNAGLQAFLDAKKAGATLRKRGSHRKIIPGETIFS